MKNNSLFIAFILFFLVLTSSFAQETNFADMFDTANESYTAEDYDQAISQYNMILESGRFSSELYFNLGNAYLQKADIGHAILNFERAKRLDPTNRRILSMLSMAREEIDSGIIEVQDFFLLRSWHALSQKLSPFSWMILQLIFGVALIYFVYKWKFSAESNKRFNGLICGLVSFFFLGVCFLAGAKSHKLLNGTENAIIMKEQVLMSGPDSRSDQLNNLSPGEKLIIMDEINSWYKVQLINKEIGWIKTENIEVI